jgi:hypothetical protein
MDTSPVSPQDIRAAAEVHEELGPEYRDAVVAAFVDKVEREVDARVRARLAAMHRAEVAPLRGGTLLKGMAIGAGAGALVAFAMTSLGGSHPVPRPPIFGQGVQHARELPVIWPHRLILEPPAHRAVGTPPKN